MLRQAFPGARLRAPALTGGVVNTGGVTDMGGVLNTGGDARDDASVEAQPA